MAGGKKARAKLKSGRLENRMRAGNGSDPRLRDVGSSRPPRSSVPHLLEESTYEDALFFKTAFARALRNENGYIQGRLKEEFPLMVYSIMEGTPNPGDARKNKNIRGPATEFFLDEKTSPLFVRTPNPVQRSEGGDANPASELRVAYRLGARDPTEDAGGSHGVACGTTARGSGDGPRPSKDTSTRRFRVIRRLRRRCRRARRRRTTTTRRDRLAPSDGDDDDETRDSRLPPSDALRWLKKTERR